jgi:hypothetical protein
LTANRTQDLLQLAGVPPSDEIAAAWLSEAIEGARSICRIAKARLLAADHNARLADIEAPAKKLIKQIERLRRHPISWRAFWRSSVFGPVHLYRVEVREVLSALDKIVDAAGTAKVHGQGRRREIGKQNIVDLAFGFFIRFSRHRPSGTRTGAFATFAREFYSVATGFEPEQHGGLDRQIRQAAKRLLPIERARLQRKSVEKPRHSS